MLKSISLSILFFTNSSLNVIQALHWIPSGPRPPLTPPLLYSVTDPDLSPPPEVRDD